MQSNRTFDIRNVLRKYASWVLILAVILSAFHYYEQDADAAAKFKLPKKKLNLYVGKSYKFNIKGCTWKSSKKKVATVTKNGKIKAIKAGNTKITAVSKKNGKKAVCTVKVGKFAKTISLVSASTVLLKPGQKSQIKVNLTPFDVLYKEFVYKSSNTDVAIVNSEGVITPVSDGMATIMATTKAVTSKGKKLTLKITVVVIGCNDNYTIVTDAEQTQEKPDMSDGLGDYTTIVVPPTSLPTSTPKPSRVPDVTNRPGATDMPDTTENPGVPEATREPGATQSPETTCTPNVTMTPVPEPTAAPTLVPTNPPKTIQDYINSFVVNPNSPLVDTLVVANNEGSMKTLYFLNKAYSGTAKIVVDGYSYSNNTNVTSFLDTLETETGGVTNSAGTVKVYRRKKTDSWAITLLKTEPKIIYYLSALKNDTKYNSPYGLIIADGNTIGHISVTN